jgi:hypothetical protein
MGVTGEHRVRVTIRLREQHGHELGYRGLMAGHRAPQI